MREKTIHEITTARYPSLLLNLFASAFLPARKNSPDKVNVINEETKKGDSEVHDRSAKPAGKRGMQMSQ